ncbi:MAG: YybH family protein [Candidatus Hodarchaeota archaeon]
MKLIVVLMMALICATLFCITGCKQPTEEAGKLSQEDVSGIKANIEAYVQADLAGDWDTFFAQFTEDVEWTWSRGAPAVEGREAMKKLNLVKALEKEFTAVTIDGRGDLGFARGTFSILLDYEDAVKIKGNFLTVHRKQSDGSWRIAVYIANY